jgi:hypothetical protein
MMGAAFQCIWLPSLGRGGMGGAQWQRTRLGRASQRILPCIYVMVGQQKSRAVEARHRCKHPIFRKGANLRLRVGRRRCR